MYAILSPLLWFSCGYCSFPAVADPMQLYFRSMLDMQLNSYSNLAHVYGYNSDNGSFRDFVVTLCKCVHGTSFSFFRFLLCLSFFFFVALVANKGI